MTSKATFRIDTASGKEIYVSSASLGEVQRISFGSTSWIAMVLGGFKSPDFVLPDDVDALKNSLFSDG